MIAGMITPAALPPPSYIIVSNSKIAFDLYHGGYHTTEVDYTPLMENLTFAGNQFILLNDTGAKKYTWTIPDDVSILFLTQSDYAYTADEMAEVKRWLSLGDRLLVTCGDSDYGGYYNATNINDLMMYLGTILRLDGTSIADDVNNDGSDYRVAVFDKYVAERPGVGIISGQLTAGIPDDHGIILHGPCSILGYMQSVSDDNPWGEYSHLRDIRLGASSFPRHVEIIYWYSANATSSDADVSDGEYDWYSYDNVTAGESGDYPAVVYEDLYHTLGVHSHMIMAGEAFYTFYKNMYNMYSENREAYGDGEIYGKMFTDNIINRFAIPIITVEKSPISFAFAILPLVMIGAIYVLMKRRR